MKQPANFRFRYTFECHDKGGRLKWIVVNRNLVPDEGGNFQISQFFLTGNNWYLGLIVTTNPSTVVFDPSDTAGKITTAAPNPPITNGWQEEAHTAEGRQQLVFTNESLSQLFAVVSMPLLFTMTASGFLGGGFVTNSSVTGSTSGILYSEVMANANAYNPNDTVRATVEFDLVPPPQ